MLVTLNGRVRVEAEAHDRLHVRWLSTASHVYRGCLVLNELGERACSEPGLM